MTERVTLASTHDGVAFGALRLAAAAPRRGGVVIAHEIFGIDAGIEEDAARFAAAGFEVVAPSLFDRASPGYVAAHDTRGIAAGLRLVAETPIAQALGDLDASVRLLRGRGPVYMVGYCYGARLAWEAAARLDGLSAVSCYYGQIGPLAAFAPRCPVICHFGAKDPHIDAAATRSAIVAAHPGIPVHVYANSGHGFNNAGAPDADPRDAALARKRTLELFAAHPD